MCRVDGIDIDLLEAERITGNWRENNQAIVKTWYSLFSLVKRVFIGGVDNEVEFKCIVIGYSKEHTAGFIRLPGGYTIWYPQPGFYRDDKRERSGFAYWKAKKNGGFPKFLWHGEIMNNVIQALARVITMGHGLQISAYPAAPWVLQVHDELVFHVRERHAEAVAEACRVVMSTPPDWCDSLPLATDVNIGKTYLECK